MKAKLIFLCALTGALVGIVVLLILHQVAQLPQIVETIVGALIGTLGIGAHAVFRDSSHESIPPQQPVAPAKVN